MIILAGSVLSLFFVSRSTERFTELTDRITAACESGDMLGAEQEISRFEKEWEQKRDKLSLIVPSDQLAEISCTVARLRHLCSHCCEDLPAECGCLRRRVSLILESQFPRLLSVF
jgi:hypothetical protein